MPSPARILATDPLLQGFASAAAPALERPLSLVQGTDQQTIRTLLELHAPPRPRILDVTWGEGRFWRGLAFRPLARIDLRPAPGVTHLGDFRNLRNLRLAARPDVRVGLPDASYDVVVFDPPGYPEAGKDSVYGDRFGLWADSSLAHAPDITHLYEPFLAEAHRVLRPNGLIMAKLTDIVHRGIMRWQVADFIAAVEAQPGLRACDRRILAHLALGKEQRATLDRLRRRAFEEHDAAVLELLEALAPKGATRAHTLSGSNWKQCRHTRCNYVVWVVVRKGSCMRPEELAWT